MEYHYQHDFLIGYGEVDEHNQLRLAALFNFLQDVATMHSKTLGYGTTECQELGIGWMVLSWHMKMFSYPKGDTNINVKTWSRGIKGIHAGRAYEVTDDNGNLVAQVDSIWALVNVASKRPMRPLPGMAEAYSAIDRNFFENEKVRINEIEHYDNQISFTVPRRDIDTNHHCNNTKYIEYAMEVVPQEVYEGQQIEELEIVYQKPVLYQEPITVGIAQIADGEWIHQIQKEDGSIATIIKTKWKKMTEKVDKEH